MYIDRRVTLSFCIIFITIIALNACSPSGTTTPTLTSTKIPQDTVKITAPPTKLVPNPTHTLIPTLTPTNETPITEIPLPELVEIALVGQEEVPDDIMEQLAFWFPTGGGGRPLSAQMTPEWILSWNNAEVDGYPRMLTWIACGLGEQPATASLSLPDGSLSHDIDVHHFLDEDSLDYCVRIDHEIGPGSQLGIYTVDLKQKDIRLVDSLTLRMPIEPVGTVYPIDDYYGDSYWFAGFRPAEQVRLHFYLSTQDEETLALFPNLSPPEELGDIRFLIAPIRFFTERQVIADANGAFLVHINTDGIPSAIGNHLIVAASGEISGKAATDDDPGMYYKSCGGSPSSRLFISDIANVTKYGDSLPFYNMPCDPRKQSYDVKCDQVQPLGTLPEGSQISIVYGPICYGYWMWEIETATHTKVWAFEADDVDYFLEPQR